LHWKSVFAFLFFLVLRACRLELTWVASVSLLAFVTACLVEVVAITDFCIPGGTCRGFSRIGSCQSVDHDERRGGPVSYWHVALIAGIITPRFYTTLESRPSSTSIDGRSLAPLLLHKGGTPGAHYDAGTHRLSAAESPALVTGILDSQSNLLACGSVYMQILVRGASCGPSFPACWAVRLFVVSSPFAPR